MPMLADSGQFFQTSFICGIQVVAICVSQLIRRPRYRGRKNRKTVNTGLVVVTAARNDESMSQMNIECALSEYENSFVETKI